MGAWIEIRIMSKMLIWFWRRSPRGSVDWNTSPQSSNMTSMVAPLVGAWIEIFPIAFSQSLINVAPLVGAWIEMYSLLAFNCASLVAPLVGAWIEICMSRSPYELSQSRSPRGSVDWNIFNNMYCIFSAVAPLVGAWIEISIAVVGCWFFTVAPLVGAWIEIINSYRLIASETVAPLVGAWIEISWTRVQLPWQRSLPSWERGLKSLRMVFSLSYHSRSPRGSVDWNLPDDMVLGLNYVAPLVGAWIEILTRSRNWSTLERRSPCGSDDWNRKDNRI